MKLTCFSSLSPIFRSCLSLEKTIYLLLLWHAFSCCCWCCFFLVFCCVWLIKTMKNSRCCYSHNEQMEESVTNRGKSNYFISCRKGGRQLCLIAFNCCNKHDMPKNSIGHNRVYWLRKVSNQNVFLTQKIPNQEANIFRKQNQFPFSKWNIINDDEFLFRIFIKKTWMWQLTEWLWAEKGTTCNDYWNVCTWSRFGKCLSVYSV